MAKIVNLNNKDGATIYPKTLTDAVYNDTGKTMTEVLTDVAYVSEKESTAPVTEKVNADTFNGKTADYYSTKTDITKVSNDITNLKKVDNSIADRTTKNETNIKVLDSRMSTFTALEDGSTSGDAELIDIRVKADGTVAESAGAAVREQVSQLSSEIVEIQNGTSIKQNAITADKMAFIQNNLVYAESKVEFQANKGASWVKKEVEFAIDLNVVELMYIYIGANNSIDNTIAQVSLYNGDTVVKTMNYDKNHIGTWIGMNTNGQGATRCKIIFRGSLDSAFAENTNVYYNDVKVLKGTTEIAYQFDDNIKFSEHQIVYDVETVVLTVKADGTGDYTNPVEACNATFPNLYGNKKYIIEVYEGEYDVYSAWTDFNKTGMYITGNNVGINLGKNVSLVGVGARESVILKCNQPNDTTWSVKGSCINMYLGGNTLENLTLIAENSRYTVHSDSANTYKDMEYLVKNCVLIHNGNASGLWQYPTCWGEGCSSGDMRVFENCTFISPRDAFGFHNNVNFDKPSRHIVRECIIKTTGNDNAVNLISMGSGQRDMVELHNCIINGAVKLTNDDVSSSDIHLVMTGCSNVEVIGATDGAEIDIA